MKRFSKRPIGQILQDGKLVSKPQVDRALDEQERSKEPLGQVLLRNKALKEWDLKASLQIQPHLGRMEDAVRIAAGDRSFLGELLVESGKITGEQLKQARKEQDRTGEKLGEVFIRLKVKPIDELKFRLDVAPIIEGKQAPDNKVDVSDAIVILSKVVGKLK